jgi:ABC-type branched-subunit amino acid transport system permease subunit
MTEILNLEFWAFVGVVAGIYTIFALGVQLQFGYTGLLNFGHVAFMAIGAYTMAILVVKTDTPLWLASLAAIGVAMLFGVILGLPTLRLRADYLAITTIAFSEIIRYVAHNEYRLTGGPQGTSSLGPEGQATTYDSSWRSFQGRIEGFLQDHVDEVVSKDVAMLLIVWIVAVALIAVLHALVRSPWGRVLKAIRDDEEAAAALGKNVFWYKLQSLTIGAALGAVAGLFYAFQFSFFSPGDFEPLITFFAWTIVILGGTARMWAVPVGALVFGVIFAGTRFFDFPPFSLLEGAERAYVRLIVIGLILIGLVAFRPQGLLGKRQEMVLE